MRRAASKGLFTQRGIVAMVAISFIALLVLAYSSLTSSPGPTPVGWSFKTSSSLDDPVDEALEELEEEEFVVNDSFETDNQTTQWKWSSDRRNIMFVKIPKTGGTTLAKILRRLADHSDMSLAEPNLGARVSTCWGTPQERQKNWDSMIKTNGGRIGFFSSHACFGPYMRSQKYWTQRRPPSVITVLRNPWDHYISKYRFTMVCCELKHWPWCSVFCPKDPATGIRTNLTHTNFLEISCPNRRCNEQRKYLGYGQPTTVIDYYSLILILERFDESLALMSVTLGVPFRALPYITENINSGARATNFSEDYRTTFVREYLKEDSYIYKLALERLHEKIAALQGEDRKRYDATLSRLITVNKHLQHVCLNRCSSISGEFSTTRRDCHADCLEQETMDLRDPDVE